RAIDNENVRPAIIVVVENCGASSGGLDDVFLCLNATEDNFHGKTSLCSDVLKISRLPDRFLISTIDRGLCPRSSWKYRPQYGRNYGQETGSREIGRAKSHRTDLRILPKPWDIALHSPLGFRDSSIESSDRSGRPICI